MNSNVRVRFAPSPTGPLHIGGLRTALYNYLFAKKHGGTFVLRIEDTDQTRYVANAEQYIIDSLEWCNIPFDEGPGKNGNLGPYRQSERKELYKKYADALIESGNAYYAFDSSEELDLKRKESEAKGETFVYNWKNRENLNNSIGKTKEEIKSRIDSGEKFVVRFKMFTTTQEGSIKTLSTRDLIRGRVDFRADLLDDKILFKSDGMPTYHLANVVDDYLMKITHVIRGEEWLPSLPLHIELYNALGWTDYKPDFAHLPLLLKPVGKGKLSKRDGDKLGFPVFPLEYTNEETGDVSRGYKEDGYFSDAFINMLSLLGWNPGTEQEIFSLEELIEAFDLSRVSKSGAKFNPDKTNWFNQQYLQQKSNSELAELYLDILNGKKIDTDITYVEKVVSLIKERAVFVKDFWELSDYFFETPVKYDEKASKKQWKEDTSEILSEVSSVIESIDDFSSLTIETKVKEWITSKEISFGKVMQPLRLSLVGAMKGPHIFDIIEMIGKEEALHRIKKIITELS